MRRPSSLAWLVVLLAAGAWDPITRPDHDVDDGNRRYAQGRFREAEQSYRAAEVRLAREPALHYDLGTALYQQAKVTPPGPDRDKRLEAAERELRLALDATDPALRARAHYNLGNTLFDRDKMGQAIDQYKRSLKLDPSRDDARHNLELALRRKPPPPPPRPSPQTDPSAQRPQPRQQGQSQPQQAPSQGAQAPADQPTPQPQAQPPPQPQPGPDPTSQPQPKQQPRAPPADLAREDLERKLDALERESNQLRAARARNESREQRRGERGKDW